MEEAGKSQKDVLELLRSIETVEDLEKNKDVILDLVIDTLRSGLDALKELLTGTASPAEIEAKFENAQSVEANMKAELDKEFDRISAIPGAEEYVQGLQGDLIGRMGAIANEMSMVMAEMMSKLMGGLMGDSMGGLMDDMTYELPEGETIEALEFIKFIQELDDLKEKKVDMINQIEKMYRTELETAKELKNSEASPEEIKEKVNDLRYRQVYIANEIEKEFDRLAEIPGGEEYLESLDDFDAEEIFINRLQPIVDDLKQLLDGLAGETRGNNMFDSFIDSDEMPEKRPELEELHFFSNINTMEELKDSKDYIFGDMDELIIADLDELGAIKEKFFPPEDAKNRLLIIDKRHQVIDVELQSEFARLEALPDAAEYVKTFREEMLEKMKPKVMELHNLLDELKKG